MLAATLYCLHKVCNWICLTPNIEVRVPIAGVQNVFRLQETGARLSSLIA